MITPKEFVELALKTEHTRPYILDSEGKPSLFMSQLDHAAKGMNTEAGEFEDAMKRYVVYGKELDRVNLIEEVGDGLWYKALALRTLDATFEQSMAAIVAKLKVRYGDTFSSERALKRDKSAEREAMIQAILANGGHV